MFFTVKERNAFAEIIFNYGFKPADFDVLNSSIYYISHLKTELSFVVSPNPRHSSIIGPYNLKTKPERIVLPAYASGMNWEDLLAAFHKWIAIVRDEIELPDLWLTAQKTSGFLFAGAVKSEDSFSSEEIKLLEERAQIVEKQILALNIPEAAKAAIAEVARDVPSEAKFFTKKKLSEVVIGQLISQGMKWALTTEHMQAIWHIFQSFSQLLLG